MTVKEPLPQKSPPKEISKVKSQKVSTPAHYELPLTKAVVLSNGTKVTRVESEQLDRNATSASWQLYSRVISN
jgi:hypothetical protein